jgi:hypothetical protein
MGFRFQESRVLGSNHRNCFYIGLKQVLEPLPRFGSSFLYVHQFGKKSAGGRACCVHVNMYMHYAPCNLQQLMRQSKFR